MKSSSDGLASQGRTQRLSLGLREEYSLSRTRATGECLNVCCFNAAHPKAFLKCGGCLESARSPGYGLQ